MLNYERKGGIVGNYVLWSKIHEQEETTWDGLFPQLVSVW